MMAIRTLINLTAPRRNDIGRVELGIQGVGLTRIDHEQQFPIPSLLPHLLERVRQVPTPNLLAVLELQELVAAVARHVHEHVAARVRAQSFAARELLREPVGEQPDEVLDRDFVAPVIDLDVVAVEIQGAVGVVVDGAGECVPRVAGHVVGEHEEDLRVRDAEAFDGAVEREDVGKVAVVEPEARGGD